MYVSCVLKVWSYTMNWHLPSASAPIKMIKAAVLVSGITYQIHIYFVSFINVYSVWWHTSSRFSIFGKYFLCIDDDFSWCLEGLAQAKIIKKSVILFWLLNMTIWCEHVHRLELQKLFIFSAAHLPVRLDIETKFPYFLFLTWLLIIRNREFRLYI